MTILENQSLKSYNTFKVEANAKSFCKIDNADALEELLSNATYRNEQKLILGGGSNILFVKDFDGLVIKNDICGIEIISETEALIKVGSGYNWDKLVEYTVNAGYNGLENLSLIPGTVGASPIQNIGAYGVEVKDVIESVEFIELETLEKKTFTNSECNFAYRDSIFKKELKDKIFISAVTFKLSRENVTNVKYDALKNYFESHQISDITPQSIRKAVIEIRESKLPNPDKIGNAGSFFKNPTISIEQFENIKSEHNDLRGYPVDKNSVKISAGWLIEKCGLKGQRVGDVSIYEKQALVIVNHNNANGNEILEFSNMITEKVEEKFNIKLENEVNIV
ncbi:MAG: UDP-N-acetylmuramate dehydrogenase, partial [Bacteroidota bacterium]